jgi:predicted phosphoadenosine phosphosulfate sulfurtransferase
MEFEEMMVLFGERYGKWEDVGGFIWIRADESLHRYRAIVSQKKWIMYNDLKWTTKVSNGVYNLYPIYDWKTSDIWIFHWKFKELTYNNVYEKMLKAGVKLWDQRLCQPYWDDQKKGIWLYQILEPKTRVKLLKRVSGVNSWSLYIKERGSINWNTYITKPENMSWQKYCNFLLSTMPPKTRENYANRFKIFMAGWKKRWYEKIPDEAPHDLEVAARVPSWKRMCRSILRNDYYCKWLGQTQPKSEAYIKLKQIKEKRKLEKTIMSTQKVN